MKKLLDVKAKATEISHKAKLLHIQILHREQKRINSDEIEEEDEFEDELFEDVDVPEPSNNSNNAAESSKLPPTQRIFPLAYEPSMMEDATYNPPGIIGDSEEE